MPLTDLQRRSLLAPPLKTSLLMAVVNATVDSFSDGGLYPDVESRKRRIDQAVSEGAQIVDIGGQSAITGVPETDAREEANAVVPLVEYVRRRHPATLVSVDTYKPAVVEAVLGAGADIINDVSGLRYPEIAELVAAADAHLVIMHNLALPKQRLTRSDLYADLVPEVSDFLRRQVSEALAKGVGKSQIILDLGPDFAKTPKQTIELLRHQRVVSALGYPLLMPVSRKDFIGAVLERNPADRLAGTLAVLAFLEAEGNFIYRVHDVQQSNDFLRMLRVMADEEDVDPNLSLPVHLRRQTIGSGDQESN